MYNQFTKITFLDSGDFKIYKSCENSTSKILLRNYIEIVFPLPNSHGSKNYNCKQALNNGFLGPSHVGASDKCPICLCSNMTFPYGYSHVFQNHCICNFFFFWLAYCCQSRVTEFKTSLRKFVFTAKWLFLKQCNHFLLMHWPDYPRSTHDTCPCEGLSWIFGGH